MTETDNVLLYLQLKDSLCIVLLRIDGLSCVVYYREVNLESGCVTVSYSCLLCIIGQSRVLRWPNL
jgi:hypothetical protein